MILKPHQTRCPACNRFVYATDALFVVENWKGIEEIRGLVPGIYHDACFRDSPHREAYLALDQAVRNAELDRADEYLVVLGRTPRLALTLRPVTGDCQLWFLTLGRMLRFRHTERWQEFLHRVMDDHPVPTPAGDRGDVRLRQTREGWELAMRQLVPIAVEWTRTDLERLRDSLTGRGVDPTRTPVDLGTVGRELGLKPVQADCPVDRLNGTFAWPDAPAQPGANVTVTVQVEVGNGVVLTTDEFEELRQFLRESART